MSIKVAPSMMCADLLNLRRDIDALERAQVDMFHIDVMDGHFVPNLALSLDLAAQIGQISAIPLDLHLMVETPEDFIESVRRVRPGFVSFHIEATRNPIRLARAFKALGVQVGVALNPATPGESLRYLIEEIDFALLMTVEPGFAGQTFIPQVLTKLEQVRELMDASHSGKAIQVDGNLNVERAQQCIDRGASILVAGTASIFRAGMDLYTSCQRFRAQLTARRVSPEAQQREVVS